MPHHQRDIVLSNFTKGILSMMSKVINKRAKQEVIQYLSTNKISIIQSRVIVIAVRDVILPF